MAPADGVHNVANVVGVLADDEALNLSHSNAIQLLTMVHPDKVLRYVHHTCLTFASIHMFARDAHIPRVLR